MLLCLLCLVMNTDFPFIPIQITLIDAVIEAFPAFFMSFEPNDSRIEGTFLGSAVRNALPNSIAIFLCCTAILLISPSLGIDSTQASLIMYLTVGIVSLEGVVKASLPFNLLHGFLSAVSVLGFFCAVFMFSPILQLPQLAANGAFLLATTVIPGVLLSVVLKVPVPDKAPMLVRK